MRPIVLASFVPFTAPLEGVCSWLYCDVKGLVTTAIGNLADPIELALDLPLRHKDGTRATQDEIVAEWNRVKERQDWRLRGGAIYKAVATLHLDADGIEHVVYRELAEMDQALARHFAGYEAWCADAQLGLLSMAWALGPHFAQGWPRFAMSMRSRDFFLAAEECTISTVGNPGVRPRNERNRVLFRNAAVVARDRMDPDQLYWPRDLLLDVPTLPALHEDDSNPTPTEAIPIMRQPPFKVVHPAIEFPVRVYGNDDDDDPEAA
jgi:hypothetical protein